MTNTKRNRERRQRRMDKKFDAYSKTLEYRLCETLLPHAGERGRDESALDCLERIIRERDQALKILALDRLKDDPLYGGTIHNEFPSVAQCPTIPSRRARR